MKRIDGREASELRKVEFTTDFIRYPEGSVLVEIGGTHVLCNASVEDQVPRWMQGSGKGWLTAEYSLLPRATHTRTPREIRGFSGRTQEIRRLIGRSLRAAVNLEQLGERMMTVDCDVLQADGGTRTAAITGGYVAIGIAVKKLASMGVIPNEVLKPPVAAVSVGIIGGDVLLDLCYEEDSQADVDFNIVMTAESQFIEVQGTAEGRPFGYTTLTKIIDLAEKGAKQLCEMQQKVLNTYEENYDCTGRRPL
jgi:ribonuclease PH